MFDELFDVVVEGKGKICVDFFCFNQMKFIVHICQKRIYGQFTQKNSIGDCIQIPALSMIEYDIEGERKLINMEGEVEVFDQIKKVNISIQRSLLSFNIDTRIGNMDLIPLRVEASLDTVLREDPLYFVFNGNMNASDQLKRYQKCVKRLFRKSRKRIKYKEEFYKILPTVC